MNTVDSIMALYDDAIDCAKLLGRCDGKMAGSAFTETDSRTMTAMYQSLDAKRSKIRAALLTALQEFAVERVGEPVAIRPTEAAMTALRRFEETCLDSEGYDVSKEVMRQLAMIGLVYHASAGRYGITDLGNYMLAAPQPAQPEQGERVDLYSLDRDTEGIRARVVHAVLGALAFGARNENKPPTGHWLSELWEAARAERARKKFYRQDAMDLRDELNSLRELQSAQPVALPLTDEQIEKLRDKTFSINNPFCPVDSKSMRKAVRATESAHGIGGAL